MGDYYYRIFVMVVFALLIPLSCFAQTDLQPAQYQFVEAKTGIKYYIDRKYTLNKLPTFLSETILLRTADNDKADTTLSISFNLPRKSTFFLAYDPRSQIQSWPYELEELYVAWIDVRLTLDIQGDPNINYMNLYSFQADSHVVLPCNRAESMYFLFIDIPKVKNK